MLMYDGKSPAYLSGIVWLSIVQPVATVSNRHQYHNNNNNNNNPICNVPDASVTDPETQRTLRNITVRVDR